MSIQTRGRNNALTCSECFGRSFSDPTRPYHYPKCSKYRAWRFKQPAGYYSEEEQDRVERMLRSTAFGCQCHLISKGLCDKCSWGADFDDGGES